MGSVWIVATGEYSDYRVNSVWATKELAEAYANRVRDADEPFEEPIRTELPEAVTVLMLSCRLTYPDCTFINERERSQDTWADDGYKPVRAEPICLGEQWAWQGGAYIDIRVEGTDHERVRKVYSEKKAFALSQIDVLVFAQKAAQSS